MMYRHRSQRNISSKPIMARLDIRPIIHHRHHQAKIPSRIHHIHPMPIMNFRWFHHSQQHIHHTPQICHHRIGTLRYRHHQSSACRKLQSSRMRKRRRSVKVHFILWQNRYYFLLTIRMKLENVYEYWMDMILQRKLPMKSDIMWRIWFANRKITSVVWQHCDMNWANYKDNTKVLHRAIDLQVRLPWNSLSKITNCR